MAVRIRLSRVGATKRPAYRVVAIDSRKPRDGRALEILGYYDPLTQPATVQIDAERLAAWVSRGALPSDTVARLIKLNGQKGAHAGVAATAEAVAAKPPKAKRVRKPAAAKPAAAEPQAATQPEVATEPKATAEPEAEAAAEPEAETAAEPVAESEAAAEPEAEAAAEPGAEAAAERVAESEAAE